MRKDEAIKKLLSKVNKTATCWIWTGRIDNDGYGALGTTRVHRWSYELHHGPIAPGNVIMHSCDVRLCVNPAHLSQGSITDNIRDRDIKGRGTKGVDKPNALLTEQQVRGARNLSRLGDTIESIAAKYKVSKSTVQDALKRRTWKHIK